MKIRTENQQPAVAQQAVEKRDEQKQATQAQPAKGSAPARKKDSVELSAALDAELAAREAEQAKKVADIKARIAAGEYDVSSRAVAEKMLPDRSES